MASPHPAMVGDDVGSDLTSPSKDVNDNKELTDVKTMFADLHKKALAIGLKQHQLRRLQFVQTARSARWKQVQHCLSRVFSISSLMVAILLMVWAADWPVSQKGIARLVFRLRGEGTEYAESQLCLMRISHQIQDLARPPTDCGFCEGVNQVLKVSKLSPAEFENKFAYSGQPVLVTDGAANWSAVHEFSFEFFKGIYRTDSPVLDSQCQFFPYRTQFKNLSHVFQMDADRARLTDGSAPWYIGWSNCDISAANILRQHYQRPYFLPANSESSKTDWIFMGSPGYGAHMHVDNVGLPSWQAQITGHKRWTLEPPPECFHKCISHMSVTVHPGQVIVLMISLIAVVLDTNKWFHSTLVEGEEISITIGSEFD